MADTLDRCRQTSRLRSLRGWVLRTTDTLCTGSCNLLVSRRLQAKNFSEVPCVKQSPLTESKDKVE